MGVGISTMVGTKMVGISTMKMLQWVGISTIYSKKGLHEAIN
jgi:hypothetical protein